MDGSLVDVGKLAEPATRLVEKISDAIGVLYRPRQIKQDAKAEARVIRAIGKLEAGAIRLVVGRPNVRFKRRPERRRRRRPCLATPSELVC